MNNFRTEKQKVSIESIYPNPWNPNWQDAATFKKEKESIKNLGMLGSILVREYRVPGMYQILDGEHRWKAAKELGYTEMTVEVMKGEVSDQDAKLLTILLNNLRGQDDVFKRAAILKELQAGQLQLLPMTNEQIENEKKLLDFDFSQYENEDTVPERKFAAVVVLPLNIEEAQLWQRTKEELLKRKLISKDNTKKKQDVQTLMYLIKQALAVYVGLQENADKSNQ